MRRWYAGLAFGLALLLSCCSHCKSFSFPNDCDDRPLCRVSSSTEVYVDHQEEEYEITAYVDVQIEYRMIMPDNSVLVIPPGVTWRDLMCAVDNTFCFDKKADSQLRRDRRSDIYLWRI